MTANVDQLGFVHAHCECGRNDVWLTCNSCNKSDRFELSEAAVHCRSEGCESEYAHATCTCGKTVPFDKLEWVPFEKGPMQLGDWELDPTRVGIAVLVLCVIVAAIGYGVYTAMG